MSEKTRSTRDGQLKRPIREDLLKIPDIVEINGESLIWKYRIGGQTKGKPHVPGGRTLLKDFISLATGPPERILNFAQKWGVLDLCEKHNLPTTHGPLPFDELSGKCKPRLNRQGDLMVFWEPLSAWRDFAQEAKALLNLAAQLHLDKQGSEKDWQDALASWAPFQQKIEEHFGKGSSPPYGVKIGRMFVAVRVNWWLGLGDVRPSFNWSDFDPRYFSVGGKGIRFAFHNRLFGAIALQLMLEISRSEGIAICSNCAEPYFPKKRPRLNERNYCTGEHCGRRAAVRDAQRDFAEKKRKAVSRKKTKKLKGA